MKNIIKIIVFMLFLAPQYTSAGEVYGRVWIVRDDNTLVARDTSISVTCPNRQPVSVIADNNGIYRTPDVGSGRCFVQVQYDDKPSIKILVSVGGQNTSTRANLELKDQGSNWSLIQR